MPKSAAVAVLALLLLTASVAVAQSPDARPIVTVGILVDGPAPDGDSVLLQGQRDLALATIREETEALTRVDFDVRFPDDKILTGDWSTAAARADADRLLADPEVDIILSLGPFATNDLARRTGLSKPVIGVWALDADAQQLPRKGHASGVKNLNYLFSSGSMMRDLRKFRELVAFDRLVVLSDSRFLATIPQVPGDIISRAAAEGIEVVPVPIDEDADEALDRIPADTEVAYLTPLFRMPLAEHRRLIAGLAAREIATFSLLGEVEVEQGVLAGLRTQADIRQIARRVALNLQRILLGEDAGTLPIELEQPQRLTINMETARAISVHPRWKTLTEARLVDDIERESGPELTIEQAVERAVAANLTLRAFDREVAAGAENIALARSAFRPQADAFMRGTQVDSDRAETSFGNLAARTVTGGLSVSQLLYSDGARANLSITRSLQDSLVLERQSERLDIALAAAQGYLDVLRAETLERVERDNVRLTESNLELAERREKIGYAGSADVYRWQAQLATARADLIAAQNRTFTARVALNRLLDRPFEEPFTAVAPALDGTGAILCCDQLEPYVDNRAGFRIFREFSVAEGLHNSPELQRFAAVIAAQERTLQAARRAYWAPELALAAEAGRDLHLAGAGSDVPFATADRNDWSITLQGTLPLFQGGGRRAEVNQASADLARLRLERDSLGQTLELRIRAALFQAGTTFPAIELAHEAAAAARKNLELVTDAYSSGLLSIIDLLDAQNSALTAEQFAANAMYDFLLDLMELQRATNSFEFFLSESARQSWYQRMGQFYTEAGYRIRTPRR